MYKQHTLTFEFVNNTSGFDEKGNDTLILSNARATVSLGAVIGRQGTTANVALYGLSMERIAQLSGRANGVLQAGEQSIFMNIYADNEIVFSGGMTASFANMNAAPETALMISATAHQGLQIIPSVPFSASGSQSIKDVVTAISSPAGYTPNFSDMDGLTTSGSPHFEGSVFGQLNQIMRQYGLAMDVQPSNTISVWRKNAQRDNVKPFISSKYGLVGYPVFSGGGIMFQTQYSPALLIGRYIDLETEVPWMSGEYQLSSVQHELSSWVPGGPWFSVCQAARTNEQRKKDQANGQ